jgi:hypothetical protein
VGAHDPAPLRAVAAALTPPGEAHHGPTDKEAKVTTEFETLLEEARGLELISLAARHRWDRARIQSELAQRSAEHDRGTG